MMKSSSADNRISVSQSADANISKQWNPTQSIGKTYRLSTNSKSHEDASFNNLSKTNKDDKHYSRSSSSSSSTSSSSSSLSPSSLSSSSTTTTITTTTTTNPFSISSNSNADLSIAQALTPLKSFEDSKLIANNDFDSHGSSIATKSSSENSGSARTGSASDSDDEHRKNIMPSTKSSLLSRTQLISNNDTTTILVNKIQFISQ